MQKMLTPEPRLFFIDNLRVFLIALVFLVHLAITYGSPLGTWYYQEGQVSMPSAVVYILFQAIVQAFFMGLLFLISGYFTPSSYDRKGSKQYLKERLTRLGIPLLIFLVVVEPIVEYAVDLSNGFFHGSFLNFFITYGFFGFGILWFVLALLVFGIAYACWRAFKPKPTKAIPFPKNSIILAFALMLGAVSFAVRLVFPTSSVSSLFSFRYGYFPQYIAFFIVGLIAFRGNWLMTIHKKTGQFWSKTSITLLAILPFIFVAGVITGGVNSFSGGFSWQAAAYAFWEQLFGIAVAIGLTVWFREKINFQNRLTKALSSSSFTAYIIQAPVLVFLALSLQSLQLPLLLKFAVVSPIGVVLCFAVAYLIRKIPKANKIL